MVGELTWYKPGKILLTTYRDSVSAEELTSTLEDIIRRIEAANATVHVIVDWRKTTNYPYFMDLFDPARKLVQHKHLGWIVIVGQSDVIKLWIELFSRVTEFRYKVFKTLDDATAFLQKVPDNE